MLLFTAHIIFTVIPMVVCLNLTGFFHLMLGLMFGDLLLFH